MLSLKACSETCNGFIKFSIDKAVAAKVLISAHACDPLCLIRCPAVFDQFKQVNLTILKDIAEHIKS